MVDVNNQQAKSIQNVWAEKKNGSHKWTMETIWYFASFSFEIFKYEIHTAADVLCTYMYAK